MGIPGELFTQSVKGFIIHGEYPSLHISEKIAMERIGQVGFLYQRIEDFISKNRSNGLYRSILSKDIDDWLGEYRGSIIELERNIVDGNSSLADMTSKLEPFLHIFRAVCELIEDLDRDSGTHGVQIFNYLHTKVLNSGNPLIRKLMVR
jgi:hypothetical protein